MISCAFLGCSGEEQAPAPRQKPAKPQAKPDKAPQPDPEVLFAPPPDGDDFGGGQNAGGALGDLAKELTLAEQEKKALALNYLKTGKNLYMQLRYREAVQHLSRATKLDPGLIEARNLLDRAEYITGVGRGGQFREPVRVMVEQRLARQEQAKIELQRLFNEGELLMKRDRFNEAEERFQRVKEGLRWLPFNIDSGELARSADERISEAKLKGAEQERLRRQMLRDAAARSSEYERANRQRALEASVRALYENAKDAFRANQFDKCIRLCEDILRRRPDHAEAGRLSERAEEAAYRHRVKQSYRDRVEHLRRQLEWVEQSAIPTQVLYQFPSPEEWARVSARDTGLESLLRRGEQTDEEQEINSRLNTQPLDLDFPRETTFEDALEFLRQVTGLNFVLSKGAKELVENESPNIASGLKVNQVKLGNALSLILDAVGGSLQWRVEDGVVKIYSGEDEVEELILRFYDVTEIVNSPPDFPAPTLGLNLGTIGGAGGGGGGGNILNLDEGDDESSGGFTSDTLVDLVNTRLGESDDEGSVEYSGGILIVRKPLEAHKRIIKLLDALRETVGVMVTVEARFVQIQQNMLEHVGIDIVNQGQSPVALPPDTFGRINNPRGLGGGPGAVNVGYNYTDRQGQANVRGAITNTLSSLAPAGLPFNITPSGGLALQYNFLDDFQLQALMDMVRKTQRQKVVNAPRITVFNGQRSHVLNINQRAYIQDVEVNQTGVIPVLNPVIGVLNAGAILEVRPAVSHDRRYVTIEVQPTLATELQPRIPAPVTLANGFTSIPIELPVITVQKLRATVTVPDGGTVLLGGLKNYDEFEGEIGVPFLVNVPLLNNLFRRQAFHKLKSSLVVLIKADITVARDEERRRFGK
ncbi:MAG: hypothetical protein KDD82_20000 [Planctomycetes bacterium]|nr:hypothetical protein [Planctomycetota bacterium]